MENQRIHLIGVCGTAMASLAGMLKQRGVEVTGSDAAAYPPMSDFLAVQGIPVMQPFAETNLKPRPDLVVVGNAISRGNPELEYALDERIPLRSMPQVLQDYFLKSRDVVVVAGTHGKTTTTSMLAWIFHEAGLSPSFLIGGIAENFGSSFALRQGKHFLLEGDEYDTAFFDKGPKFLHYMPLHVLLTHVEFDHADIYKDLDAVKTAFKRLVNLVPRRGSLMVFEGSVHAKECAHKAFCRVQFYGFRETANWRAVEMHAGPERTTWKILHDGKLWGDFEFSLPGAFNVLNATGAAALAAEMGIEAKTVASALASFKNVKRRQEVKAEIDGITIIDDFAHHPTAIAATLEALRTRYAGRRLWAIFEPRSNTLRRKVLERELIESLTLADEVVLASLYKPESVPVAERLETSNVVQALRECGITARELADADAIVASIAQELKSGDVVAILSNGGFDGIYEKLPRRLMSLRETTA